MPIFRANVQNGREHASCAYIPQTVFGVLIPAFLEEKANGYHHSSVSGGKSQWIPSSESSAPELLLLRH